MDYQQLRKGMLCILKPRYLPCVYLKALNSGKSLVLSFCKESEVLTENIVMLKAPVLQPGTPVYYFDKD